MTSAELLAAAKAEADSRQAAYVTAKGRGRLSIDAATRDYRCWVAIAHVLETGGQLPAWAAEPDPPIDWGGLEGAARSAADAVARALQKAISDQDDARAVRLGVRLSGLKAIARVINLRGESVAAVNARWAERRRNLGRKAA